MQVDLFLETYTDLEFREIIKFYRSPIGRKTIQSMPEISRKGLERGAAIGKSLTESPKVQAMLSDKIKLLIAEGKLR